MLVQHNILAMNASRQFGINNNKKVKSMEKLSSGYRINRAADDAAGLAISEKMRRQIRGLSQASLNSQEGISMIQVADGAMEEIHEMLQRGNELAVKASNGTLTSTDREYIQKEMEQLKDEIDSLSYRTEFNEIKILRAVKEPQINHSPGKAIIVGGFPSWAPINGEADGYMSGTYTTQYTYVDATGAEAQHNIDHQATFIDFSGFDGSDAKKQELMKGGFYTTCCTCDNHYSITFTADAGNSVEESGNHYIYKIGLSGITDAQALIDAIVDGTDSGKPEGHYTVLEKNAANANQLVIYDIRSSGSKPAGTNTNMSLNGSEGWKDWSPSRWDIQFDTEAHLMEGYGTFGVGVAYDGVDFTFFRDPVNVYIQVGSEAGQHMDIELPEISCLTLGVDMVQLTDEAKAGSAINLFKKAIEYVNTERSRMGAYQNRLEHTVKNLDNVVENTQASESIIRDADMAKEMVEFSKQNILTQVGQSMMAQANQSNQGVLSLLG